MVADFLLVVEVTPGDEQEFIAAMTITADKADTGGRDEVDVLLS